MNKTEQKRANKWLYRLQEMQAEMEELVSNLDQKVSNRSERYAETEKGQQEQNEYSALQDVLSYVESAIDSLGNIDLSEVQ